MQLMHDLVNMGHTKESAAAQLNAELETRIRERYPLSFQQHWSSLMLYIDKALLFLADSMVTYAVMLAEVSPELEIKGGYAEQMERIQEGLDTLQLQTKYDMLIALEEREAAEQTGEEETT